MIRRCLDKDPSRRLRDIGDARFDLDGSPQGPEESSFEPGGRGTDQRFTFEPTYNAAPVWTPDGGRLTFFSIRDGRWSLWEEAAAGTGVETALLSGSHDLVPNDWSPDGAHLLFTELAVDTTGADIWVMTRAQGAGKEPQRKPFVRTPADENFARFSPDGRWVVYSSNQSGRYEVYVRPFPASDPGPGGMLISTGGGIEPTWPSGGKEIFYVGADNMLMAVDVKAGVTLEAGVPRPLFRTAPARVIRYDAGPADSGFWSRLGPTRRSQRRSPYC